MSDFLNSPLGMILVFSAASLAIWLLFGGWQWREHRSWERREQLRQQLWEMEQQIREEQMSDEEREWHRQSRARQAEIRREARYRLGLPEEEA